MLLFLVCQRNVCCRDTVIQFREFEQSSHRSICRSKYCCIITASEVSEYGRFLMAHQHIKGHANV